MSESTDRPGFSFLLSESPPTAAVEDAAETPAHPGTGSAQDDFSLNFGEQPRSAAQSPSGCAQPRSRGTSPEPSSPRIKRIEFPARRPAQPTQFSASLQRPRMDVRSDDEFPTLSEPEDLPGLGAEVEPEWSQETPTPGQLWKKAQSGLGKTAHRAAAWGSSTMVGSRRVAANVSSALRQRMEAHAERRAAVAASEHREHDPPDPRPASAALSTPTPEASVPAAPVPPTRTRRPIVFPLLAAAGRKLAAPASAIAAAAVVYTAGTSVFGTEGISLSASSTAPGVPELGTLTAPGGEPEADAPSSGAREADDASKTAAPTPAGPAPVQTEETKMPDGLSWPGKGLIEVVTTEDELIYVDGVFTGRGPLRRIPVGPGDHEVSVKKDGQERQGVVAVQVDRCTRAVFKGD